MKFKFKKQRPTPSQIEVILKRNLRNEFEFQRERIHAMANLLGKGSLQYQPYIKEMTLTPDARSDSREYLPWIKNAESFYSDLLQIKGFSALDTLAASMETDNQVINTALAILLMDRGIDLHDYGTILRQAALTFHTSGLEPVFSFLGINPVRPTNEN
jgi:hypothetical protein